LLSAFGNIMVNEINKIPNDNINKKIERSAQDKQEGFINELFFSFIQQAKTVAGFHIKSSGNNRKKNRDEKKLQYLFFNCFLQCIQPDDHESHKVSEDDTQHHENTKTGKDDPAGFCITHFFKRVSKKNIDKGKQSPSAYLKQPVS
jgi:hypothetical protein